MKVKQSADDFVVEERSDVAPGPAGPFALYRLTKTGWTTPDALAEVGRQWKLDRRRVSFGGLKDRYARTTQFVTVEDGPPQDLAVGTLAVTFLGRVEQPFTSAGIRANAFTLTLRALPPADRPRLESALAEVESAGLPNYFDDQRFGSVTHGGGFVARELVFGRFEAGLKLALTAPYEFDRPEAKQEKATLLRHWGRWAECVRQLPRGHAKDLAGFLLARRGDYRGAIARLRPELQGLYLAAYQSHLWNRMLARWLRDRFPPTALVTLHQKRDAVPAPRSVPAELAAAWAGLSLPLPSARLKPDPAADWAGVVDAVLGEEGLTLGKMKVPGMQKPFFSKGDRPGCVRPAGLSSTFAADDRHPGASKLTLAFELPRGSYATMLVKRITAAGGGR